MDIEKFKSMLKEHGSVIAVYPAIHENGGPFSLRYVLKRNCVFEVFDYNRTEYLVCNIEDEKNMCDNFLMNCPEELIPSEIPSWCQPYD